MDPVTLELLLDAAVAAGIGLFIGLEREHSDVEGAHSEDHVGVRTLAILALFGWMCAVLGDHLPWLPPAGLLVAGGLVLAHYFRVGGRDLGLTTEVAAAATFALGMLVHFHRDAAVAVGLVITLLLVAKPWFRRTIPRLRQVELSATVQLGIVLAVVLPLLPAEALDPWGVLSPRKIGLFIVLIAGVGYVGYFLHRLLGPSRGAVVSGLVGGLVSSTAVTVAMAQQSRTDERMVLPGQIAVLLANIVLLARVLVITAFIDRGIAASLVLPLGSMAAVLLAALAYKLRAARSGGQSDSPGATPLTNPFALVPALQWGALLSVVLVASAAAREQFGERGLLVVAAASGLADVDAVILAISRQYQQGDLTAATATLAVTIGVVANAVVKGALAIALGRKGFGRSLAAALAAAVLVGLAVGYALR